MPGPSRAPRRTYNQFCPLARSLDLLGERWTLLIVRDLLMGPQRYKDLLEGLPGIGTNLLAARLKQLERLAVVRRRRLPAPAGSMVYELTPLGDELAAALLPLMRWGLWTLRQPARRPFFRPLWVILAFKISFRHEAAEGVHATYEFRIDGEVFQIRVEDRVATVRQAPAEKRDLVFQCSGSTFMAIASGALSPPEAMASGKVVIDATPEVLARFIELFPAPNAAAMPR